MSVLPSATYAGTDEALWAAAGGGGGGGVSSVTASGAGITATPTSGAVVLANTGVTSLIAGAGISVSAAVGAITVALAGGAGALESYPDSAGGTAYYINLGPACIFFNKSISSNIAGPTLGQFFVSLPPPCRVVGSRGVITGLSNPRLTAPLVEQPVTVDALPTVSVDTIGFYSSFVRLPDGSGVPGANISMIGFWSTSLIPA